MSGTPDIEENNEQILNDIQSLQSMEEQLLTSLETNPNLTSTQQQDIIQKMNQLSTMRINLYQTLGGVNGFFQSALSSSIGTLQEQTSAIAIVENELNQAKERLEILEEEKNNKIRLVEINDYYGEKYAEHSQLMKIVIFTLIPIIILIFLKNKGIIPNSVYTGLVVIIALIGIYFFWYRFASIITRDNMNYQEYDWYFNPNAVPSGSSSSNDPWGGLEMGTCVGQYCCFAGQDYDASLNQCVGDSTVDVSNNATPSSSQTEGFTTESMVNKVLTKTSGNRKTSYTINGNNSVKPMQSESFINYIGKR
jgi:hypothetical protein